MMTPAELEAVRALVDAAAPFIPHMPHTDACTCPRCRQAANLILAVHAARNLIKANEGKAPT